MSPRIRTTSRLTTTDQGGLSITKDLVVPVVDVNESPTGINVSSASVAENQPPGTTVGTFTSVDPDIGGSHTYALVSGPGDTDNASFTIDGNQLKTGASFDYETKNSYSIRIRTTDQGGLSHDEVFTINVTDVHENPPTAQGPTPDPVLDEDSSVAITLHGTDADNPDLGAVGFSIVSGHDVQHGTLVAGALTQDSPGHYSQVFTYTPTPDWNGSDGFQFVFTSEGESTQGVNVAVTVNPVNDAPEITVPGDQSTGVDASLVFSTNTGNPITVYDDAGTEPIRIGGLM